MLVLLLSLSACAAKNIAPKTQITDMDCDEILFSITETNRELSDLEITISDAMDIRTGGVISAQGGSNSGVGIGVGISLGAPLNSYRKRKATLKAKELRANLFQLQNEALAKQCY